MLCPAEGEGKFGLDCRGRGTCNVTTGVCACKPFSGYGGRGCELGGPCKNNCTSDEQGACLFDTEKKKGVCQCTKDWEGDDCSVDLRCPVDKHPTVACSGHGICD
jgi:hypothetical protein